MSALGQKQDITLIDISVSGPVVICAVKSGSLIYQFGEATTEFNVKNLLDALSARAFVMCQRIKLAFY
jgi:hypothetical protein